MNLLGRGEDSISLGIVCMIVGDPFTIRSEPAGARDHPTAHVTQRRGLLAVLYHDHRTGVSL